MYQCASSKPKSSESSSERRQFYTSIQYMHQISLCAFKLKINGHGFYNGRNVGHRPQVFIQIQTNEEFKAHGRLEGQEKSGTRRQSSLLDV